MMDPRILQYRDAALAMSHGVFDEVLPLAPPDEIGQLGAALAALGSTLERRFGEVQTLARLTEKVGAGLLLDDVLDHVYEAFGTLIPYDRIGFALLDEDGATLRAHWARTTYDAVQLKAGFSYPLEGSSLQRVLTSRRPRILNDLEAYLAEHPASESTRRIVAEGIRSSLACPLIARGRPVGVMFFSSRTRGMYRDAHVELFQQIAGQLAMLVEKGRLYQHLVEVDAQRAALLGVVAHDLRNPIGVVRGLAQLMRREKFGACTSGQGDVLDRMVSSCDRMLAMVNDLLDVSAIEAGHVRMRRETVSPGSWLASAVEAERLLAAAKNIRVDLDADDTLPRVNLDPVRMSQVLSNLVGNAVKYSPQGSVVTVRARAVNGTLRIQVVDRGPGIPADEISKLFKPFGRTSVQPTGGETSTGLGLAICRRIVEAHGGSVGVTSTVGRGSTFTVSLPVVDVPAPSSSAESELKTVG